MYVQYCEMNILKNKYPHLQGTAWIVRTTLLLNHHLSPNIEHLRLYRKFSGVPLPQPGPRFPLTACLACGFVLLFWNSMESCRLHSFLSGSFHSAHFWGLSLCGCILFIHSFVLLGSTLYGCTPVCLFLVLLTDMWNISSLDPWWIKLLPTVVYTFWGHLFSLLLGKW